MFDLKKEWNICFSGCGFMGVYYVGASSCILERFPELIQNASKISGASCGALVAAAVTIGISMEVCCAELMYFAKEAKKHKLGPMSPAFNLLQMVKESLLRMLPEDAHVRASGKLSVSLTRVPDGKNVLASEFDTKEELIQALICSCFIPIYCGVIPPTYRGIHYMDGAISNNMPHCDQRNTLTFSAYAGKSDICPRDGTRYFHAINFRNVNIQLNSENVYRVASTFFPPELQILGGVCHSGYMDALRFLQENCLIHVESPLEPKPYCCELEAAQTREKNKAPWWLDHTDIHNLPVRIKKVVCEACREGHEGGSPLTQASYLPVESIFSLGRRLVDWLPGVSQDMTWLYHRAGELYKQAWIDEPLMELKGYTPLRRCTSLPAHLDVCYPREETEQVEMLPLTLTPPPTSSNIFFLDSMDTYTNPDFLPLTPPPTPTTNLEFGCVVDAKCQTRLNPEP